MWPRHAGRQLIDHVRDQGMRLFAFLNGVLTGVLHSRNVVDDFRNLLGKDIEIWKLELLNTFKTKFDWFYGARDV